ncbi:2-hydroxyacid dehydrogenase [Agromyces atrinae]|uniref:2-hydroxyacid dehydrogenase n=1 Tax=Agromyces atrinae TaxID=592376 RepID=UPI001F58870C|nr:2-hydroxyacid dehydrogenase [Agromyces atrinae]MCI2957083.1 2-hydroxyacid dehydrogenase [Agromyces atrinae]
MSDRLLVTVPGQTLFDALGTPPDGVDVLVWDLETPPPAAHIDIVVPPYMGLADKLGILEGVSTGLVQGQSIGYDGIPDILPAGHVYANASSVHETSTAELTLALILAVQRGIPGFVRAGDAGEWRPSRHASLADRTVLLVGVGGVGNAIEDRLLPFETNVVRSGRTARDDERGHVHAFDELPELLPTADIVVIGVPLSPETRGMVDAEFLAAMPDGALLVNIARGPVVDTDALLAELTSGRLRAALDVTDPEPLPTGHPLWSAPNLLISPHVGGDSNAMMPRMAALLRSQIELMLAGDEPRNVVVTT